MLQVGDVVVIKPESSVTPRSSWRLGRVQSLVVGKDEHVRGANLSTRTATDRTSIIARPLQKIVPFEILPESVRSESSSTLNTPMPDMQNTLPSEDIANGARPRRACAVLGERQRRDASQK